MKQSLLFAESPLQLLNAQEAIYKFKLTDYKIMIRLSSKKINDEQLINLVDKFSMKNVEYIHIRAENKKIIDFAKLLFTKIRFFMTKVDKIFIGNYNSGYFKLIIKQFPKNKIILLDDGAKSIVIQKKFSNDNFYNLFTMYDLKPLKEQKIFKNEYRFIEERLGDRHINKNSILFLGMKLSEYGIIEEEYYVELFKQISNRYKTKNIVYITHRGEDANKLNKISKIENIAIKELGYPVELYGLYEDILPYKVTSFYSTALYTMQNIYSIEAESFIFDYKNSQYTQQIDEVYKYYANYIKVTELDD